MELSEGYASIAAVCCRQLAAASDYISASPLMSAPSASAQRLAGTTVLVKTVKVDLLTKALVLCPGVDSARPTSSLSLLPGQ